MSQRRRREWPDVDAAHAHFASKPAFARFAEGVLADYVRAGMRAEPGRGLALAFEPEIEARIYASLPNHIGRLLRRKPLDVPLAFVGGTDSREIRLAGLAATERASAGRLSFIEGSHLFPLEKPRETAAAVLAWLDTPPFL